MSFTSTVSIHPLFLPFSLHFSRKNSTNENWRRQQRNLENQKKENLEKYERNLKKDEREKNGNKKNLERKPRVGRTVSKRLCLEVHTSFTSTMKVSFLSRGIISRMQLFSV
jgi:hypothetical protein